MGRTAWRRWIVTVLATLVVAAVVGVPYRMARDRRVEKAAIKRKTATERATASVLLTDSERASRIVTNQPSLAIEPARPAAFAPPRAGSRGLLASGASRRVPRPLLEGLAFLETADRVEVTWEQGMRVNLLQIGSSFRLQTSPIDHPQQPGNTITVVGDTAYIEDRGTDFRRPLTRFTVPANDLQPPYLAWWWIALREVTSVSGFDSKASAAGTVFTEVGTVPSSDSPEERLSEYTVNTRNRFTSFRVLGINYEVSVPAGRSALRPPPWSVNFANPPMSWDDSIPNGYPKWVKPVISVASVRAASPPLSPLASQCGFAPFSPQELPSGMAQLPRGSAFRCQVNLEDVPAGIGLPPHGLLQFFLVNQFESGFVRYFPTASTEEHDPGLAQAIPLDEFSNQVVLRFTPAHTAPDVVVRSFTPRSFAYRRSSGTVSGTELSTSDLTRALSKRGVTDFVPNDVDLMGGQWEGNGATGNGYTRLFMNSDDVGYAYWHIPTADLRAGRFDRVDAGWTD